MAVIYTENGWVEVNLPPFIDFDEICRNQYEEEIKQSEEKQK